MEGIGGLQGRKQELRAPGPRRDQELLHLVELRTCSERDETQRIHLAPQIHVPAQILRRKVKLHLPPERGGDVVLFRSGVRRARVHHRWRHLQWRLL